jgi:hypothetical protein
MNHIEILISFLNSALDFKDKYKIKYITIANLYQIPKIEELKIAKQYNCLKKKWKYMIMFLCNIRKHRVL